MARISETRVREAAEDLVRVRYGETSPNTAAIAGEDMRDWQLSGSRVERAKRAGKKAAEMVKRRPTRRKVGRIQDQINQAMR